MLNKLVSFFTSLKLTVVLLAFGIVLVFIGTLAQVDEGLYQAQSHYFRQWLVVAPHMFGYKILILLPGGYLIGTLLLINLISAHIYRFKFAWKRTGILLTHAGVVLLLVGQLVTDMLAHESQMRLEEGELQEEFSESSLDYELVFLHGDEVTAVPAKLLQHGDSIHPGNLPFSVRAISYWKNSQPSFRAPMMQNGPPATTNGIATSFDFQPVVETKTMDEKNVPTAMIELTAGGATTQWIVSGWASDESMANALEGDYARQLGPQMASTIASRLTATQTITVDGKTYEFSLRPQRVYHPFSLTLLKATHTVYPGTMTAENPEGIPKDFRSRVRIQNSHTGENREVEIYMNNPLRYQGLTFYQYQMTAGEMIANTGETPSSVLQVVHNPSWLTPYVGCGLVAVGLITQFLIHLVGFMSKRRKP